ncbi:MAG: 4Fe-4S binding protein [Euryarchaeota archaeon]|nr:4Fe-4S binding protein [Euryarchaeota archaeon]
MPVKKYTSKDGRFTIEIDEDKCIAAGECVNSCPVSLYEIIDSKSNPVRIDDCTECCVCVEVCPTGAIKHSSCPK